MNQDNKIAVITGATGGLGKLVARQLSHNGTRLVLVSSNEEKLKKLAGELNTSPVENFSITADLTQPESAQDIFDKSISRFGRADILLHFVGGWMGGKPLSQVTDEELTRMLNQHLWTTFHLSKVFIPHMVSNGWGRFIAISTPNVASTPGNSGPYTIGKAAQEALFSTLAQEIKGTGVTANMVRVQTIDTGHEREKNPSPKTASWTTPEEISAAVQYLCSHEAGMINGGFIPLHGNPKN